jgi:hypothetical protein
VAVVTVLDASVVGSIAFGRPADLTDDAFLAQLDELGAERDTKAISELQYCKEPTRLLDSVRRATLGSLAGDYGRGKRCGVGDAEEGMEWYR